MLKNPHTGTASYCVGLDSLAYIDVIAVHSNIHHCTKHNVQGAPYYTLYTMPLVP